MTKKYFLTSLIVPSLATLCVGFVNVTPKVIYGEDNRADYYELEDAALREAAESTVALIPRHQLKKDSQEVFNLSSATFGRDQNMCADEPFIDQPDAANCSGSLVGDDLVATAGHCVNESTCKNFYYVFGYRMADAHNTPMSFPASEVYTCKEIVAREYSSTKDFALLRLNRKVPNHRPLVMQSTPVHPGDELYIVGHPAGLPTKISGGAKVRTLKGTYFNANLDSYGGNSGSAVFNARTHEIVGILVRGDQDFVYDKVQSCSRSRVCDNEGCRGEDVTNITYVVEALAQR